MKKRIREYFKNHPRISRSAKIVMSATRSFTSYEINAMGAQLAYYSIVAFFTLGVTLVYASSFVPIIKEAATGATNTLFPSAITSLFDSIVSQIYLPNQLVPMITTGIASIWFASRAIRAMMHSFDTIFNARHAKKDFQRTYRSMLFTLVFEVLLATILVFSVFGKAISRRIFFPLQLSGQFIALWTLARLVFPVILMLLSFWFFYFYLTNVKIKFIHAFPGALFSTVLWMIITNFFSLYFTSITLLPSLLGSLGSIFIFLVWIYWCSIIVLVGAVLNYRFMLWRTLAASAKAKKTLHKTDA